MWRDATIGKIWPDHGQNVVVHIILCLRHVSGNGRCWNYLQCVVFTQDPYMRCLGIEFAIARHGQWQQLSRH